MSMRGSAWRLAHILFLQSSPEAPHPWTLKSHPPGEGGGPAEAQHCQLHTPSFLTLYSPHALGPPLCRGVALPPAGLLSPHRAAHLWDPRKGAPETTAWSLTPRLEWVARHAAPGSRVLVESGLMGGGALPRRACRCTAGLGAGLGWSLSHLGLPGPCSPQGSRCWGESGG